MDLVTYCWLKISGAISGNQGKWFYAVENTVNKHIIWTDLLHEHRKTLADIQEQQISWLLYKCSQKLSLLLSKANREVTWIYFIGKQFFLTPR